MHDIFNLPPGGYPEELLPIRQEIVNRTAAGQIDAAFEMYQYELARLRELGIPVFEMPREYFELEKRLRWPDEEPGEATSLALSRRMQDIELAAGIPRERVDNPSAAGMPPELLLAWAGVQQAAQGSREELRLLLEDYAALQRSYGILLPDLSPEATDEEEYGPEDAEEDAHLASYRELHRSMAEAVFLGDIDAVMRIQEELMIAAGLADQPCRRMPREFYELQHAFSQAARRNDEAELARLQQRLQELGQSSQLARGDFSDPAGLIRLPPEYAQLFVDCEQAFREGDYSLALGISLRMQQLLEDSGSLFGLINTENTEDSGTS